MVRVAKAAVSALALLVGVASAAPTWINLPTTSRQIAPAQLLTTFNRDFVQSGQACPERITHLDAIVGDPIVTVPHTNITQNDQQCSNPGRMIISAQRDRIPGFGAALNNNDNAQRVLDAIDGVDEISPLVGLQPNARQCGTTTLAANTILVFLREAFEVRIGPGLALSPRQRFMLVMQPDDSDPCVFVAPPGAAVTPPPVAPASPDETEEPTTMPAPASPQPQPDTTVVPVPVPVVVPPQQGSPAPGPGATADPAAPVDPVESPEDGEDGVAGGGSGVGSQGDDGVGGEIDESPSESPDDDDDICFPADATVQLADGSVKTMEQVALNDKVVVNGGEHSDVFMFTHRMKETMNKFVRLSTVEGSLTATAGHYIYVNDKLTAMCAVNVGDSLTRQDGSSAVVTKIEEVMARGLFNPQTLHGDIYVNGFKASTYTQSVEPTFAHTILAPFRALHLVGMNPLANAFEKGSNFLVQFAPRGAMAY